jgi:hypothetical protein
MAVTIPWYLALVFIIPRRMRATDPSYWQSLGRPLPPFEMSIAAGIRFRKWVLAGEYVNLTDASTIHSCVMFRRLYRIATIAFPITLLATFALFYIAR